MPAPAVALGIAATILVSVPLLVAGSLGAPTDDSCVAGFDANGQSAAMPASASTAGLDATQLAARGHHHQRRPQPADARPGDRGRPCDRPAGVTSAGVRQRRRPGELAADQRGIEASLDLPHEAVGRDHGSLGIFQQQWPWWGSMTELMDPVTSADLFYDALERVPRWQSLPVTVAAQAVQKSAYPSAYADDEPLARRLLLELGAGAAGVSVDCGLATGGGVVQFPLPPDSGYVDRRNFGATGASWRSRHTGTDFSVACGTPVFAAHSGTVHVRTDQSWSGRWLVQVEVAPGRLTTWYAHMQAITVAAGDWVRAGRGGRCGGPGGQRHRVPSALRGPPPRRRHLRGSGRPQRVAGRERRHESQWLRWIGEPRRCETSRSRSVRPRRSHPERAVSERCPRATARRTYWESTTLERSARMRVQQSRTHVLPLTWEIPATIAASWLFLSLMVLPVGQGAASWLEGEGFSWPEGRVVETTLAAAPWAARRRSCPGVRADRAPRSGCRRCGCARTRPLVAHLRARHPARTRQPPRGVRWRSGPAICGVGGR